MKDQFVKVYLTKEEKAEIKKTSNDLSMSESGYLLLLHKIYRLDLLKKGKRNKSVKHV
jgi:hypothetical protein